MRILKFFWTAIYVAVVSVVRFFVFLTKMEWHFAMRYIHMVNEYTGNGTLGIDGSAKPTHWIIRYPIRVFLWALIPVVVLLAPVGLIAVVTGILVVIDQATYPMFPINDVFVNIDATPADGTQPSVEEVGSALLTASYHQMESELDSVFGWAPNDTLGLQFFDNRLNRQLGVRHASIELLSSLISNITKFGSTDSEDARLVTARQGGFTNDPTFSAWTTFPFIESRYRDGIQNVKDYQSAVRGKEVGVRVNITNANIATILDSIGQKVLEVPRGYLTSRNREVNWMALDNEVFFAQGAAIVARDALVVIKNSYHAKIAERGAVENLNKAIESLEGVLSYHPWTVTRGEGDSMFADSRSKLSRYYTEAVTRIADVASALRG